MRRRRRQCTTYFYLRMRLGNGPNPSGSHERYGMCDTSERKYALAVGAAFLQWRQTGLFELLFLRIMQKKSLDQIKLSKNRKQNPTIRQYSFPLLYMTRKMLVAYRSNAIKLPPTYTCHFQICAAATRGYGNGKYQREFIWMRARAEFSASAYFFDMCCSMLDEEMQIFMWHRAVWSYGVGVGVKISAFMHVCFA